MRTLWIFALVVLAACVSYAQEYYAADTVHVADPAHVVAVTTGTDDARAARQFGFGGGRYGGRYGGYGGRYGGSYGSYGGRYGSYGGRYGGFGGRYGGYGGRYGGYGGRYGGFGR